MSDLPGRWCIELSAAALVGVPILPDSDDGHLYSSTGHFVRYGFSRKRFTAGAKSAAKNVAALVPDVRILPSGVWDYSGYVGGVVAFDPVELELKARSGPCFTS